MTPAATPCHLRLPLGDGAVVGSAEQSRRADNGHGGGGTGGAAAAAGRPRHLGAAFLDEGWFQGFDDSHAAALKGQGE